MLHRDSYMLTVQLRKLKFEHENMESLSDGFLDLWSVKRALIEK